MYKKNAMHVQRCCFAKCKSIAFLPFSLPSPTLFLKLPIVVIQKCCYHVVLPHAQLKKQLHDLLEIILILKEKASLLPIIFPPGRMIRRQRGTRTSPVESLVSLLTFFIDNIYVCFGSSVFRQVIGIPMGTKSAPLLADLFLHTFEYDFMVKTMKQDITKAIQFSNTFQYIYDLFSITM